MLTYEEAEKVYKKLIDEYIELIEPLETDEDMINDETDNDSIAELQGVHDELLEPIYLHNPSSSSLLYGYNLYQPIHVWPLLQDEILLGFKSLYQWNNFY